MKKILMENKWKFLWSSLIILVPVLTNGITWGKVYLYPFWMLLMHWFCLLFTLRDRQNRRQTKKVLGMIFWIVPILTLFSTAVIYLVRSGAELSSILPLLVCWPMGLIFLLCGNYFPKVRQNRTIGIKVKWALENEENWNATHRFGGKVWVAGGFLCLICGLFPMRSLALDLMIVITIVTALVPIIYSYLYYRRQLREGTVEKTPVKPRVAVVTGMLLLATAAFVVWVLFSGSMEMVYGEESFTVEVGGWSDLTVRYDDVEEITYYEEDPSAEYSGMRTGGFGNLRFGMGRFYNELYGDYTRYTYSSCDACVVLKVSGETIVLNGPDADSTREIYENISRAAGL